MSPRAAEQGQLGGVQDKPANERRQEQHDQASHGQQQQLLNHHSATVSLVAPQQKLHRRKPHALVAQSVEEVNDDRHRHQCGTGQNDRRVQKILR